jgi:hypothetical protein
MNKFIFIGFLLFSCNNVSMPDFEKDKKEILQLEAKQREYHFTGNAKAFTAMFSKDFLSINKGIISNPTREKSYEMFDTYFKSSEFIKWDDNEKPLVRFSDDGSVAYAAVDKKVIVKVAVSNGKEIIDTTDFAWLTIYKKYKNEWKIDCVCSTNK